MNLNRTFLLMTFCSAFTLSGCLPDLSGGDDSDSGSGSGIEENSGSEAGGTESGGGNSTGALRTPDPATYAIGNAVAPINNWMNAWTLNDLIKTTGFGTDDQSAVSHMWVPSIGGQWNMDQHNLIVKDSAGWPTQMTLSDGTHPEGLSFITTLLGSETEGAYVSGNYDFYYEGEGIMVITGAEVTSEEDGHWVLNYPGSGAVFIEIADTDPNAKGDYLRNMRLMRPDAVEGERFSRDYQPFAVMRPLHMLGDELVYPFPDADGTYSFTQGAGAWDKRKPVSHSHWGGAMGAPYEVIVDLANQSQTDLWLNIPTSADDEYVRNLAQLMLDTLDPERVLYLELGNEFWNWSYPYAIGRNYALEQAQARWPGVYGQSTSWSEDAVSESMMVHSWQAARTLEIGAVFDDVWGDQAERLALVLAGQSGGSTPEWNINELILGAPVYVNEENATPPGLLVDAFAVAPYVSDPYQIAEEEGENGFDRSSAAAFLAEAIEYVNGTGRFGEDAEEPGLRYYVRSDKAMADSYNLPLVAYEGGQHFLGSLFTRDVVALHDDNYELYQTYFDMWQEEGGGLFVHLHGIIPRGQSEEGVEPGFFESEHFGVKETQQQTEADAPRYRALMDEMRGTGQL